MTYEQAVRRLVDDYYDRIDIDEVKEIIEHGLVGVRQMTNSQIVAAFDERFGEGLVFVDRHANPNGEG